MKVFTTVFLFCVSIQAQSLSDQVEALLQLHQRVHYFLTINHTILNQQRECLLKHDISKLKSDDVKRADPICYQILDEFLNDSAKTLHEMRYLKGLASAPIPFFLDLFPKQLGNIPDHAIIKNDIDYEVVFKDQPSKDRKKIGVSELTPNEVKAARDYFELFRKKNCEDFVAMYSSRRHFVDFSSRHNFCEVILSNKIDTIEKEPYGLGILNDYSSYLKLNYQNKFRNLVKSEYESKINARPYLALISGLNYLKTQFSGAINYAWNSSNRNLSERKKKDQHFKIDSLLQRIEGNSVDSKELEEVVNYLKDDFEISQVAANILINKDFKKSDSYSLLYAQHIRNELLIKMGLSALQLTSAVLCLFPPGKIVLGTSRALVGLLGRAGIEGFQLTRMQFLGLCSMAIAAPLQTYLSIDGYKKSQELHDLLFSQVDGKTIFTEISALDEEQSKFVLNAITLPIEGFIAAQTIREFAPLSIQIRQSIIKYLQAREIAKAISKTK